MGTRAMDVTTATALMLVLALFRAPIAAAETPATGATEPPEATVRPGCTLSGRVVDERRAPVSEAKIQAFHDPGGRRVSALYPKARDVAATVTTDARGGFSFAGLSPAKVELEISAVGFLDRSVPTLDLSGCETRFELGEIVLATGAEISGLATDRLGRPVAGAYVGGRSVEPESRARWTTSAADGRFSLRGLPHGQPVTLRASRKGYFMGEVVTVEPPFPTPVTLTLERFADLPEVVGQTVDAHGRPVAGANLNIQKSRVGEGLYGSPVHESSFSKSDADGRFALLGVTVPSFTVQASAEGFQDAKVEIADYRPGSEVVLILEPSARVEGTVLDARGRPVAHATVFLVAEDPVAPYHSASTGDDGRYRLAGLPPGPRSIALRRFPNGPRTAVRDLALEPGSNHLDFALEPNSAVSGVVLDEAGRPVAGVVVDFHTEGTGGGSPAATATTGGGGTFAVALPRGLYAVEIHKQGSPFVRFEDRVRVPSGAEVSGIELVLPDGGSIAGAVHGSPVDRRPQHDPCRRSARWQLDRGGRIQRWNGMGGAGHHLDRAGDRALSRVAGACNRFKRRFVSAGTVGRPCRGQDSRRCLVSETILLDHEADLRIKQERWHQVVQDLGFADRDQEGPEDHPELPRTHECDLSHHPKGVRVDRTSR